jgi:hypothetical protein
MCQHERESIKHQPKENGDYHVNRNKPDSERKIEPILSLKPNLDFFLKTRK